MGYDAYITRYHLVNKSNTIIIREDSDINKIVKAIIDNQNMFEYEDIDSWCSNGRYWMDFVYDNIDPSLRTKADVGQYILIRSAADYAKLAIVTAQLMETASYQFGKVVYAMADRHDDGSFRCFPLDGVIIQCEDGSVRHVWDEYDDDGFLIPKTCEDQFTTIQQFVRAVLLAANTDWDNEFILLGGSY